MLSLGIAAFLLVVFTVGAYAVRVGKPSAAWPVLITFYLALGLFCFASNWIVQRNLFMLRPAPPVNLEVPR
jgi:hypothetical protein